MGDGDGDGGMGFGCRDREDFVCESDCSSSSECAYEYHL